MTTIEANFRVRTVSSSAPSWIAQPGQIKSIATNSIYAARNPNIVLNSITQIYSQARSFYNPYYGSYGARVMFGGGHGGYVGNEVYVMQYGAETGQWLRLTDPYPAPLTFNQAAATGWYDPLLVDRTNGEFLVNGEAGVYFGYCPWSDHTRNKTIAVPGGTNNMGRMVLPCNQGYPGGGFDTTKTHIFDFGKEGGVPTYNKATAYWSRGGDLKDANPSAVYATSNDACWRETDLGRIGFIANSTSGYVLALVKILYYYYNGTTANPTAHWELGGTITGYRDNTGGLSASMGGDNGMGFIASRKLLLLQANSGQFGLGIYYHMVDLARPSPHPANVMIVAGPNPPLYSASGLQNGASVEYCPIDGYFYGLFCANSRPKNDLWRLKPQDPGINPKDPNITNAQLMAANWVWEEITDRMPTIEGWWDTHRQDTGVGLIFGYNRLQWSDSMECFTWDGGAGDPSTNQYGQALLINPIGV